MAVPKSSIQQRARSKSAICTLCLGPFNKPKLLPCFHTFCENCLYNLTAQYLYRSFPCPVCRAQIQIPTGGVSAFQTNFYIDPEDKSSHCTEHPTKELDLYCLLCKLPVCVKCMFAKHKGHRMQDITETAEVAKGQLSTYRDELDRNATELKKHVQCVKISQKSLAETKSSLQKDVHAQHARVVAAADKCRDQILEVVEKLTASVQNAVKSDLEQQQRNQEETAKQLKHVQDVLNFSEDHDLVKKAAEISDLETETVSKLAPTESSHSFFDLELYHICSENSLLARMRDFFGTVSTADCMSFSKVIVKVQCQCGPSAPDVYSLCPVQNGHVALSYEPSSTAEKTPPQVSGSCFCRVVQTRFDGRVTLQNVFGEEYMYLRAKYTSGGCRTFAKSKTSLLLDSNEAGFGQLYNVKMTSTKMFTSAWEPLYTVNCNCHHAFDTNSSCSFFAVLEEGKAQDPQRSVKLYESHNSSPTATYAPPVEPFQPSDVCFYNLNGQEVLLVADELNSTIHVVRVQEGQLQFLHYLAEGCPVLVHPTALNTDVSGVVWVACRGGVIITCKPVT
ncbi:hypothetical protein BaRGS_00005240 [Batillaria attramentaria]|uniref:Uncharacterized protein n=1 Tax=Batillaria attramentaria TaxID=370345 RepID=A0ABD0LX72_9CAEN